MSPARLATALPLALAAIAAGACYESAVPLAPPGEALPLDPALLGSWTEILEAGKKKAPGKLRIDRWDDKNYSAQLENPEEDTIRVRAWLVKIDGTVFLDVQNIADAEAEKRTHVFFRYRVEKDGTLELRILDEKAFPEKLATTKALREHVRKHLADPKLLGSTLRFRRT